MRNLLKKLTFDQRLVLIKGMTLIISTCVLLNLLGDEPVPEEDNGVSYLNEQGEWIEFDTWKDFVAWTLQHKEKVPIKIDWGDN